MDNTNIAILGFIAILPSAMFLYWYLWRPRTPRKALKKIVALETETLEREPANRDAHYNRGLAYHRLGKHENAIDDLTETLELNPDYAAAYIARGNAYADLKRYDNAVEDYTSAIRINPDDALAYYNRAQVYHYFLGEHERALNDAIKAIEYNPADAGGYLIAGYVFRRQEKYSEALTYLKKYVELEDGKVPPLVLDTIMYIEAKSQ